jgi:hypothetical protein
LYYDSIRKKHIIIGGYFDVSIPYENYLIVYDSILNFEDSIILSSYLWGNSNILPYKNSGYLVSGRGVDDINFSSLYDQLRIQILDSNLNTITYKSFKYDNYSFLRSGYIQNLIQNQHKEYFIAGYLEKSFLQNVAFGVFIVKVDSNLNKIWQKRIPGNESMKCARILATNDGGLLINVIMNDTLTNNSNAYLIKIGPNGELTSMLNLGPVKNAKVQVFPNPAKDFIECKIDNLSDRIMFVELYNIEGKLLEKKEMRNATKINVESLKSGVYFVSCTLQSGQKCTGKFVKE